MAAAAVRGNRGRRGRSHHPARCCQHRLLHPGDPVRDGAECGNPV